MRPFVLLICGLSLLAQPAWGWQRMVCRDGTPCNPPAAAPADAEPCCVPAPCDSRPVAPVEPCVLSAPPHGDAVPSAARGDEVDKPVLLAIATIPSDAPLRTSDFVEDLNAPALDSSSARRLHAARAPPRIA